MSVGHKPTELTKKTDAELYKMLGEGDTYQLYARPYTLNTSYDWPYAGGNSVNGKTVYIDRVLYQEIMSGKVKVKGMTPRQIVEAWCEHEHTEWSCEMGDNPCDSYEPSHEFANAKEDRYVEMLPKNPDTYNEEIRPGLQRCLRRFIANAKTVKPPYDVWCGPILDHPDATDRELIRILRAHGVKDSFKVSKPGVNYGLGPDECRACAMFARKATLPHLHACNLVSGLVRDDRYCTRWIARK